MTNNGLPPPSERGQSSTNEGVTDQQVSANRPKAIISMRNLTKVYTIGETRVPALRGISLEVQRNEFIAIMGPSGSGKSTLMNLIGCLDHPTSGDYWLVGEPVNKMNAYELANVRNRRIGFVFQVFNLLPRTTALGNVALPLVYAGLPKEEREHRAYELLKLVGLGNRASHRPSQLSGGQQQRIAIARALVNNPSLLLADEPTGNLDSRTGAEIMATFQALHQRGLTIVLVTHDLKMAAYSQRQVELYDGRIIRDEPQPSLSNLHVPESDRKTATNGSSPANTQHEEEAS